jgi:hypothetical protein
MANKHMKKCLISLAIKEMQIKNQNDTDIPYSPSQKYFQDKNNNKCWRGCGENEYHILLVGMQPL